MQQSQGALGLKLKIRVQVLPNEEIEEFEVDGAQKLSDLLDLVQQKFNMLQEGCFYKADQLLDLEKTLQEQGVDSSNQLEFRIRDPLSHSQMQKNCNPPNMDTTMVFHPSQNQQTMSQKFSPPDVIPLVTPGQQQEGQSSSYEMSFIKQSQSLLLSTAIQPQIGQFVDNAPKRKLTSSGLNIMGPCQNQQCEAFKKDVINQLMFQGPFQMEQHIASAKCVICMEPLSDIHTLIFVNCKFQIDRIEKGVPTKKKAGIANVQNGFMQILKSQLHGWSKIVVQVEPL